MALGIISLIFVTLICFSVIKTKESNMSNSIEERAALNLRYERDFLGNDLSENMVRRAYIRGATEQKVIDAEWLRSQMKTLYDDERYDPNIEYWVNEFKKATK